MPKTCSSVCGDSTYDAMCQLNVAFLPGYTGKVLRVRHIIHSPMFDFDEGKTVDDYVNVLADIFSGVLSASEGEMLAPHVKFHFRSPAERSFFNTLQDILSKRPIFAGVEMRGAWLYISKR